VIVTIISIKIFFRTIIEQLYIIVFLSRIFLIYSLYF